MKWILFLLLPAVAFAAQQYPYPGAYGSGGLECVHFAILDPADADDGVLFHVEYPVTVTSIDCLVDPADSGEDIAVTLRECDSTGDNCADIEAAITCDNDGAAEASGIDNAGLDAGDWVAVLYGAPTGTVGILSYSMCWRR